MLVKVMLIVIITSAMFMALWKPMIGLVIPPLSLWGYEWAAGFTEISVKMMVVITIIHITFETIGCWLSGKYREGNLAFTGAGITGFSTAVLASMFFGALMGFFMWLGFIGRIVTKPIAIGAGTITRSFAGGLLKIVYGAVMSAVLSYVII